MIGNLNLPYYFGNGVAVQVYDVVGGTSYELEYQTYTTTVIVRGDSVRAREMTDDDMRYMFIPGKKVSITYCPEYYGNYQRLITITFE